MSGQGPVMSERALVEILAENLAGVRRVVHVAHGSCLSVVVRIIDELDVQ